MMAVSVLVVLFSTTSRSLSLSLSVSHVSIYGHHDRVADWTEGREPQTPLGALVRCFGAAVIHYLGEHSAKLVRSAKGMEWFITNAEGPSYEPLVPRQVCGSIIA